MFNYVCEKVAGFAYICLQLSKNGAGLHMEPYSICHFMKTLQFFQGDVTNYLKILQDLHMDVSNYITENI
jgi:hypothetical protein